MTALQEPFRYDYVGSFLRPEKVRKRRHYTKMGKLKKKN